MSDSIVIGSVVVSTKGKDYNKLYVVKQINNSDVELINGLNKHYLNPKRKNIKHIKKTTQVVDINFLNIDRINNDVVKHLKDSKSKFNSQGAN